MLGLLQIVQGPDEGKSFALPRGQMVQIGRGEDNRINLADAKVSRAHCQVQVDGDCVHLTDCESTSGTWVNGQRIQSCQLQPGDLITIGRTELSFRWSSDDEQLTETLHPLLPS